MTDEADHLDGWQADPYRRFDQRYWNGSQWTEHVTRGTTRTADPVASQLPPPLALARPKTMTLGDVEELKHADRRARVGVIVLVAFVVVLMGLYAGGRIRDDRIAAQCRQEHPTDPQFWQPCIDQAQRDNWP